MQKVLKGPPSTPNRNRVESDVLNPLVPDVQKWSHVQEQFCSVAVEWYYV